MPEPRTGPATPAGEDRLLRRQQHAAERMQEDESLTADLTDTQAAPVLRWAEQQATLIAADPSRSDAEVDTMLALLRRAIKRAGDTANGDDPAEAILITVRRELQTLLEAFADTPPEDPAPAPQALPPPPPPPPFNPPAPPPFNPPQPARLGNVPPLPPAFNPPMPPASELLPEPAPSAAPAAPAAPATAPEPTPPAAPAAPEPPAAEDKPLPPSPFNPPSHSSS